MTIQEAVQHIKETKQPFYVKFIKRTTGQVRTMRAQTDFSAHLRGGKAPYDAAGRGLIVVLDLEKLEIRSIPMGGILALEVNGVWHDVDGIEITAKPMEERKGPDAHVDWWNEQGQQEDHL